MERAGRLMLPWVVLGGLQAERESVVFFEPILFK
jgi:hypothetical protein